MSARAHRRISINESFFPVGQRGFPGWGENHGQRREQTVGRRGESRTEEIADRGKSINYTADLEQK